MRVSGIADVAAMPAACSSAAPGTAGTIGTSSTPLVQRAKPRNSLLIVLTALLLLCLGVEEPRAQAESSEARVAEILKANPTFGILVFKLTLWDAETHKESRCNERRAHFVGPDGETRQARTYIGRPFGQPPISQEAIMALPPGTNVLEAISCEDRSLRNKFKGRFATITMKTGEVISGGHLVVQYKHDLGLFSNKFNSRQTVKDFDSATIASFKQRLPVSFVKAVKRNLTPVNSLPGA